VNTKLKEEFMSNKEKIVTNSDNDSLDDLMGPDPGDSASSR